MQVWHITQRQMIPGLCRYWDNQVNHLRHIAKNLVMLS